MGLASGEWGGVVDDVDCIVQGAVNEVKCRIAFLESVRGVQSLYMGIL